MTALHELRVKAEIAQLYSSLASDVEPVGAEHVWISMDQTLNEQRTALVR